MSLKDDCLFQIRIMTSILYDSNGSINIVVKRPYAYLTTNLGDVFKGQEDVRVTVDRRYSERRKNEPEANTRDRRREDRRQIKETLVDVVISD